LRRSKAFRPFVSALKPGDDKETNDDADAGYDSDVDGDADDDGGVGRGSNSARVGSW